MQIFEKLKAYVQAKGIIVPDGTMVIKTTPEENDWLTNLRILVKQRYSYGFSAVIFSYNNENYYSIIGFSNTIEQDSVLLSYEINAGIFIALVNELDINIIKNTSASEIFDNILYQFAQPEYQGTELNDVMPFFETITLYKIQQTSPIPVNDISRCTGYYLAQNIEYLDLKFSVDTIRFFEKIFLEGCDQLPFENILISLISTYWKFAFLDIYRCIERLFPVASLNDLYNKFNYTSSITEFSKDIEESIKWRPNEESSIKILFQDIPQLSESLLTNIKNNDSEFSNSNLYTWFYKRLRNSIVHYRAIHQNLNYADSEWNDIILASLHIVFYIYDKHKSIL